MLARREKDKLQSNKVDGWRDKFKVPLRSFFFSVIPSVLLIVTMPFKPKKAESSRN